LRHAAAHPARSIGFLSRLHDGELTPAERREFELHSAECVECSSAAAEFEAVLALYREAREEPADPALAERIARRLDARLRWRPPVRYVRLEIDLLWTSVVATCLVGVLSLYSFRFRSRPAPVSIVAETRSTSVSPATGQESPAEETAPRPIPDRPGRSAARAGELAPKATSHSPRTAVEAPERSEERQDRAAAAPPELPASEPSTASRDALSEAPARATAGAPSTLRDEPAAAAASVPPVLIRRVEPVLSESLRRNLRSEGPFTAQAVITESGDVASVRISPHAPPGLERPIVAALLRWKYKPALRDGRPVPAYLNVVVYVNPK
jgi:protein TonB